MSIIRSSAIALSLSLALSACVGNPDDTQTAVVSTANASEPTALPREYYGRTEFEIPGGDGQVLDYQ
jgi:starvation-inducible outer membrane lipoprotein